MDGDILAAVVARRAYLRAAFRVNASKELWNDIKACERLILKLEPSFSLLALSVTPAGPSLVQQMTPAFPGQFALSAPKN